jgi:Predicted membrane protein
MTILKFAFLTAVIYPILPDKSYGPFDAFNPKEIWKVVIIISIIDFIPRVRNSNINRISKKTPWWQLKF